MFIYVLCRLCSAIRVICSVLHCPSVNNASSYARARAPMAVPPGSLLFRPRALTLLVDHVICQAARCCVCKYVPTCLSSILTFGFRIELLAYVLTS